MLRSTVAPLLAALLLTACQASADDAAPPRELPPLRVMVAGDSLAGGYYASDVAHGFTARVQDDLATDHTVTPVTVAVPGARALGVALQVAEDMADEDPVDVVVLEVGGNDVGESTLRAWKQTYERLLDAVDVSSPGAQVVCLGPWSPPRLSRPYEAVVRRLCADRIYVPISDLYAKDGFRGPAGTRTALGNRDGFHPNDRGHAGIARRVLAALAPVLGR